MKDHAAVLYLYRLTDSLNYRAYAEPLLRGTVLDWCMERFRSREPHMPLYVLTNDGELEPSRRWKAARAELLLYRGNQMQAFVQAARTIRARHLVFLQLPFFLGPEDLISRTLAHHLRHRNDYTRASVLPGGCAPEIFRSTLLRTVAALDAPFLPAVPGDAVQMLLSVSRTTTDLPFRLRATPFDPSHAYALDSTQLPERVMIDGPGDVKRVRKMLGSDVPKRRAPCAALTFWKRELMREHRSELGVPRPPARRGRGRSFRPRVLVVTGHPTFTGAAESLCDLIGHMDHSRFSIIAQVDREGLLTRRLREAGARVICPERNLLSESASNFMVFDRIVRSAAPDLIHFNSQASKGALHAALASRVPIVQHVRSNIGPGATEQVRTGDAIIAISKLIRAEVLNLDVAPSSVHLIYNGVNIRRFRYQGSPRARVRRRLGLPADGQIVLMVARYVPYKRHDLLIAAAARLSRQMKRLHLVLVGDSSERPDHHGSVLDQIRAAGLEGRTTLLGFQTEIETVIAAADVVVLCSDREPFGISVSQAMALGTPVVVTDSCGCAEVLGDLGVVVPSGNAQALGDALHATLTDEGAARQRARAARQFVEGSFSTDHSAQAVSRVYRGLLHIS